MDKFTDYILDQTGLAGMIGKAERGPVAVEAIKKHGAVYLMAVGGAAYLVSQAITRAEVVAFEDLGMEAIYAFTVKDMPVSVAVDSQGESVHVTGPQIWKAQIEEQALGSSETFYWHDYETSGATVSRIASQFAGVRTNVDFEIIGEPLTSRKTDTRSFTSSRRCQGHWHYSSGSTIQRAPRSRVHRAHSH